MKVYIRSYKIPTVLIIVGGAITVMSGSTFTDKFEWFLLVVGVFCLALGIAGWASVQVGKLFKGDGKKYKAAPASAQTQSNSGKRRH